MSEREDWIRIIELVRDEYEFNEDDGYKLVFGPWSTLSNRDTAFFTDFPSRNTPQDATKDLISEDKRNTYEKELRSWRPRINRELSINEQFMDLSTFIHRKPLEIMTGVATPFRTDKFDRFNNDQQRVTRFIGRIFWTRPLMQPSIRLIITSGRNASDMVLRITKAKPKKSVVFEKHVDSGKNKIYLEKYLTSCGKTVIKLPYLGGRLKIFGNPDRESQLNEIFKGTITDAWKLKI